jgi:holo-[acyl-carrier protein] synthase
MTLGLGIDIVDTRRFSAWLARPGMVARFFSAEEEKAARSKGLEAAASLAVRFAAKEAFGKALGTGLSGLKLRDIEVAQDERGKPFLRLSGAARDKLSAMGASAAHVSLSHDGDQAVAVVIIEG